MIAVAVPVMTSVAPRIVMDLSCVRRRKLECH